MACRSHLKAMNGQNTSLKEVWQAERSGESVRREYNVFAYIQWFPAE